MGRLLSSLLALSLFAACPGGSDRTTQQLEALQKKKEADAKSKAEEREKRLAPPAVEAVSLPAPYDDTRATVIQQDGPCPEGFWALFPTGDVPGATPEEKKANAARRKELADGLRARQYLVKLRAPTQVVLSPYDAPRGQFTVDVAGTIDCTDSIGRIAIAWTDAKAGDPGTSAAKEGAEVTQNVWVAPPVTFALPIKSLTEAKTFGDQNRFGLAARVGFSLGKVEIDKKVKRIAKVSEKAAGEELSFGGGNEDWGAGRLVRAEVLGVRVATDREKKELFEQKPGK